MKLFELVKRKATRAYLWVGEHLGLSHYRSCWDCGWVRKVERDLEMQESYKHYRRAVCYCQKVAIDDGDGVPMTCSPSEAVWCPFFKEDV